MFIREGGHGIHRRRATFLFQPGKDLNETPIPVIATLGCHCVLLLEARDDGFDAVPYRRSSVDEGWVYRSLLSGSDERKRIRCCHETD